MFANIIIKFIWVSFMSKKESINKLLKHKRIIIVSLLAIGLIIMIMLIYILTYANNKPKPFSSDKNVKITNKCDYFDFTVFAEELDLKGIDDKPSMDVKGKITNLKEKISDVKVSFEVHTNWTTKTDVSDSSVSFNSGKTLNPTSSSVDAYYSDIKTIGLLVKYPVKVIPLVRVKNPTVYAKVTYTRTKPDSMHGEGGTVTESVYYKFNFSDYCVDDITVIK